MAERKQSHSQLIQLDLSADNDALGRVIEFCVISKHGNPDAFIYNSIMKGYFAVPMPKNCIHLHTQVTNVARLCCTQWIYLPFCYKNLLQW